MKSTVRPPCWARPTEADAIWSPLNSGGVPLADRSRTWPSLAGRRAERDEVEPAGLADELADGVDVRDARQLDDHAVAALGQDDRLRHAGRVHAPLDDVLDDAHGRCGRRLAVLGQRLVLDAEAALQVEPELGLDRARLRPALDESGSLRPGKKSMRRAATPMSRMRMGPALRIRAGWYTKRPTAAGPPARETGSGLERGLDPLGQRATDARHGGDLLDRRLAHALDRTEDLEQLALALRADAGQVVEGAADRPLGRARSRW